MKGCPVSPTGRPPRFTPVQVAEVKALACQLPVESGAPLSRWTCPELAYEAVLRGIAESVSASTIRRWLADDALKPWQYRSWISIRDPNFAAKATRVLDLYQRMWDGQPLGPDEYVISSDEKPSIQPAAAATPPCCPRHGPGDARRTRIGPGRSTDHLAAYDVHRAILHGRRAASTGIEPFMTLVEQVMSQEPYKSATRVFWIVVNGSSHHGQKAINRHGHDPHPHPRVRRGETDHVLVGPQGAWAVEVKLRRVRLTVRGDRWWYETFDRYQNLVDSGPAIDGGGITGVTSA